MNRNDFPKIILIVAVVIIASLVGYFVINKRFEPISTQKTSSQDQAQLTAQYSQGAGFVAEVTGARTTKISAPGAFFCLPEYKYSPSRTRPSYLVLTDNQGVRENGITFLIPRDKPAGTYNLVSSPDPSIVGSVFEVRAELSSTVDYFNKETNGTITIISMPKGTLSSKKYPLKGSFVLETSNSQQERVKIKGSFDFPAPHDESKYCP